MISLKMKSIFIIGKTINICRTTNQERRSELEYAITWELKDVSSVESFEVEQDRQETLKLAVETMKRASEEMESIYGKP